MKTSLVALALFAAIGLHAAPSIHLLAGGGSEIRLPAGHSAAWLAWDGGGRYRSGIAIDSDGDGVIRDAWGTRGYTFIVADLATGEWATAARGSATAPEPLAAGTILQGTTGAYTEIVVPSSSYYYYTYGGLWIRPGVGAWGPAADGLKQSVLGDRYQLYSTGTAFAPLGTSPAIPAGFERGDLLLLMDSGEVHGGTVDAQLDAPNTPGEVRWWNSRTRITEGQRLRGYVIRTGGTATGFTARVTLDAGTAQPGLDYEPATYELVFAPGDTFKEFEVVTVDDALHVQGTPGERTLRLTQRDANGAALTESLVQIGENDPAPVFGFGQYAAEYPEGDVPWTLNVPVRLTGAWRGSYRGSLEVLGSLRQNIPLLFEQGQTELLVPVTIPADRAPSPDLFISLRIGNVVRDVTIRDDDQPQPVVRDGGATEGDRSVTVSVDFDRRPAAPWSLRWATADGTARAGEDYVAVASSTGELRLTLIDDRVIEGPETFYVEILEASGGIRMPERTRIAVTILDDDQPPPVTVDSIRVEEGNSGTRSIPVVVRLATPVQWTVRLDVAASDSGTATRHFEFVFNPRELAFAPGTTVMSVPLEVVGDIGDEDDEAIEITASHNGSVIAAGIITIADDDTLTFVSAEDATVIETTGEPASLVFRVAFNPPPVVGGSFRYTTVDGTARAGTDYAQASGVVTFAPGDVARNVTVDILGDADREEDETFQLRLSDVNAAGVYLHRDVATATIFDDDRVVVRSRVAIDDVFVRETNDWSETAFTLRLSKAFTEPVNVSWNTADGSAAAPSDYEQGSGVVTFAPGETEQKIVVRVAGDRAVEPSEWFGVELWGADGLVIEDRRGVCTIENDDAETPPAPPRPGKRRSSRH